MPIYDFICSRCDHKWDDLISYEESLRMMCPECCSLKVDKLVAAPPGFVPDRDAYERYLHKTGRV